MEHLERATRNPQQGVNASSRPNEHPRAGRIELSTVRTAAVAEPVELAEPSIRSAQQAAEDEGLTFAGTPGPGYSEGGDVYEPKAASKDPL